MSGAVLQTHHPTNALLRSPDTPLRAGNTPLMLAASHGNGPHVLKLVKAGSEIDHVNKHGDTALILVSDCSSSASDSAAARASAVEALIVAGAKLDVQDRHGETALIRAARSGDAAALAVLIPAHNKRVRKSVNGGRRKLYATASLDIQDQGGQTALMAAAINGHVACMKALIRGKCDLTVQDNRLDTALTMSVRHGNLDALKYLLYAGAVDKGGEAMRVAQQFNDDLAMELLRKAKDGDVDGDSSSDDDASFEGISLVDL